MKILKDILSESKEYYLDIKRKIQKKLELMPAGSVKKRRIYGKEYYYLQERIGKKIKQRYIGKEKPLELIDRIETRKKLKKDLKEVDEALKIITRSEGRKRG